MPAEIPPPPPFEITPELQDQLALLTRQAMAQLAALVAALEAATAQLQLPPPPPETIIPITPEPPPGIFTDGLELSMLALEPPILLSGSIEKGEGGGWSRPMPLAVEMSRMIAVDLPVIAVEPAATPQPAGFPPAGFASAEVVDLSGFWRDITGHGGEGGVV